MTENDPRGALDDLDARLKKVRKANEDNDIRRPKLKSEDSGFGQAVRVGADLVSALLVGVAIGYGLDAWLDTKPWMMIVFIFLGGAAGILNVYRTTMAMASDAGGNKGGNEDQNGVKIAESDDSSKNTPEK